MTDFLNFKKMITPLIIKVLFWIMVALSVIVGLVGIVAGASSYGGGLAVLGGLAWIILGPLVARIYCELLIVIFSINENLTEMNERGKSGSVK